MKTITIKKIENKFFLKIIYIIALAAMLEPDVCKTNLYIHSMFTIMRIIIGGVSFLLFIREKKIPVSIITFVPFIVIQFISLVLNGVPFSTYLGEWILEICSIFFFSYMLHKNNKEFVENVYILFWIYVVINLLYMICNPWSNEYDASGFLGGKNAFGPIAITILMITFIKLQYEVISKKKRVKLGVLIGFVIIENLWLGSSTSIIGMLCMLLLYVCLKGIPSNKKIFKGLYIAQWGLFCAIVLFRIQEIFASLILRLFNKNASLTGRTMLWDSAMELIKERWLLGYGTNEIVSVTNSWNVTRVTAAHNGILDLLVMGGVLLLVVYEIYAIASAIHSENRCNRCVQICIIAWFSFRVLLLAEYYFMSAYFILIITTLHYSHRFDFEREG